MKKLIVLIALSIPFHLAAQTQKIGHADWVYIFSKMPEMKEIQSVLKTHEAQLTGQLETKKRDWDTKYKAFQSLPSTTPETIKKDKQDELAFLEENMRKFHVEAQQYLQKKESELMAPVFDKVGKAIEAVAKENGFAYIINPQVTGGGDVLLFADEQYNISNLVLRKMGITPVLTQPE
ncbi:OmpH family outer membrane protein [Pseudochryseolinea flava]|uniref:OmpH family outer membrane protein n=1 Tax=Pseudochryseolinea flava TaxID=2059302 RepID=A0A364XY21_9BACT|nr:OmpH family outer membrane protein [Pseudochryseolinea flava]RAV98470.1 OmpH family outer membrane protein [Pseudochryseolinea flava]